jgi:hypothetical protein
MKKQTSKLKLPGKFDPQTRWLIGYFLVTLLVLWVWQGLQSAYRPRNAAPREPVPTLEVAVATAPNVTERKL